MLGTGWFVDRFAHFWTLGVEEQFYLLWPLAILAIPRRWLLPITGVCVAVGPAWRGYALYRGAPSTYIAPLACVDSLGLGALLALVLHPTVNAPALLRRLCSAPLLVTAGASLLAALTFVRPLSLRADVMLFDFAMSLVFCGTTRLAWDGAPGLLGRVFALSPIAYVGQISYGIYLLHPFAREAVSALAGWLPAGAVGLVAIGLCLALATISWHWFERPITRLIARPT